LEYKATYSGINLPNLGDKFYFQFQNYPEEGGDGFLKKENRTRHNCPFGWLEARCICLELHSDTVTKTCSEVNA
jgi:hypothetical protein